MDEIKNEVVEETGEKTKVPGAGRLKFARSASLVMLAAGVLAAVAFCVISVIFFEPDVQYFKYGALIPVIYVIFAAVFCVFAFVCGVLTPKSETPEVYVPRFGAARLVNTALSLAAAAMIVAWDVQEVLRFSSLPDVIGDADVYKRYSIVLGISIITSVFAVIYFVLTALPSAKLDRVRAAFGFVTVLFFVAHLLVLYYDVSAPINSPLRVMDQLANVAAMLFVTAELHLRLTEPRPRFLPPFTAVAVHFLLAISLTRIVLKFAGIIDFEMPAFAYVFELVLALYAAFRLVGFKYEVRGKEEEASQEPEEYPYDPRYSPSGNPYADLDENDPRYVPPEKLGKDGDGTRGEN